MKRPMPQTNFRYSFSGSDCRAFAFFPYSYVNKSLLQKRIKELENYLAANSDLPAYQEEVILKRMDGLSTRVESFLGDTVEFESLATISISVHEPKGLVRRLGHRSVSGVTRSVRTIAGSLILTVVDDHPLTQLMAIDPQTVLLGERGDFRLSWSKDDVGGKGQGTWENEGKRWLKLPTMISPFSLMLQYVSEYATKVAGYGRCNLLLEGVEFLNEGIVTSVNDMVTEVTYQFIATDLKDFSRGHTSSESMLPPTMQDLLDAATASATEPLEEKPSPAPAPLEPTRGRTGVFIYEVDR